MERHQAGRTFDQVKYSQKKFTLNAIVTGVRQISGSSGETGIDSTQHDITTTLSGVEGCPQMKSVIPRM